MGGGWKVPFRSLINTKDMQIEYAKVLHETLFVPTLTYDSERSRIRAVEMDNLRDLIGIRRI